MKLIIVNADDLGADLPRNAGIFEAVEAGVVTSVSILANGPGTDDAICRIQGLPNRDISIGIHLNISEGFPLSSGLQLLVGSDGRFRGKKAVHELLQGPEVPGLEAEIRKELQSQIDILRRRGLQFDHMDGHQHVHVFPRAVQAVLDLAKASGIRWIRIPEEHGSGSLYAPDSASLMEEAALFSRYAAQASLRSREAGICSTDSFRGLYLKGKLPSSQWLQFLEDLPDGLTELMVHPGKQADSAGPFASFSIRDREMELDALINGCFQAALAKTGVRLSPFPEAAR